MGNPTEPPIFVKSLDSVEFVAVQFIPPAEIRVEFTKQLTKKLATKKLIRKARGISSIELAPDDDGYHIWRISPKMTKNGYYPFDIFITEFLAYEVADALYNGGVERQVVLSRELWLKKSYDAQIEAQDEIEHWRSTKHPCGKTHQELLALNSGHYEIGEYFVWRGQWLDGARNADGFHTLKISGYKPYDSDIRYFLKEGYNLRDAVRIQDEMFMENFRTMIAALANFYAAAPGTGSKPRVIRPNRRIVKRTSPNKSTVDTVVSSIEKSIQLAAETFSVYGEVANAMSHYEEKTFNRHLEKKIRSDVKMVTDFLEKITTRE